jgi:hypothetical protein
MVFSADAPGAALVAVVVVGDTVVGSVVDEQPAINTTTHAASPAHCAWETIIVATTASVRCRTLTRQRHSR